MRKGKRFLAGILAAALVFTGSGFGNASTAQAAETKSEVYYNDNISGELKKSKDDGFVTISTTKDDEAGSPTQAPFIVGETVSGTDIANCGSDRYACLVFTVPDNMNLTHLNSARVTLRITGANNVSDSKWAKAALYQTANADVGDGKDETKYRALNNDYSKEAAMWSEEKITDGNAQGAVKNGDIHFDVTKAVRAVQPGGRLVLRVQGSKGGVTINGSVAPKLSIDATLPSAITIKYEDADGNELKQSKTVDVSVGSSYTYDVEDSEKILTKDGKTYNLAQNQNLTLANVSETAESNVITVLYEEDALTGPASDEPIPVVTREGVAPELPAKAEASFSSGNTAMMDVTWDEIAEEKYAAAGSFTATGKFTGTQISVSASVTVKTLDSFLIADYSFDDPNSFTDGSGRLAKAEKVNTVNSIDGLKGKAAELPGGGQNKGSIKLPEDLLVVDGTVQDDFTVSLYMKLADKAQQATALMLHADDVNKAWTSQTKVRNHICLVNRKNGEAETGLWMQYSKFERLNGTQAEGPDHLLGGRHIAPTDAGTWAHIAVVTKGSTGEAWLYKNGVEVASLDNITVKASDLAGRLNYLGCTDWPDTDIAAAYDEFKVYNAALSAGEVKNICDETLYKEQIQKTKEALEITSADDSVTYDPSNVTANLVLPTNGAGIGTTVTWSSSKPEVIKQDGTVIRPSRSEGNQSVVLTATIQAGEHKDTKDFPVTVTALEGVNFDGLTLAVNNAETAYRRAVAKNIYTEASLTELNAAIQTAKELEAEKDNPDTEVTSEEIKAAVTALEAAVEKPLALKNFEELNETLEAWYPLDDPEKKAEDASGKGNHAAAAESIEFNREDGAVFPGGTALENIITLPADKLGVTDQMTFSFWANAAASKNMFGIGTNLGEPNKTNGGGSKHFYLTSALNAYVTEKGWSSGGHKGFSGVEFTKNEWHHITAVLDGKELTLYIDKVKIGAQETDIGLKAAWDAEGPSYAYLGNCAYGHNNDGDFEGSIKDFRIYNAALAEEQIADVYNYVDTLPMKYAKDDLLKAMGGTVQKDGSVKLDVTNLTTENEILTLPKTSYGEATVAWTSTDDNIINASTGKVSLPGLDEEEKTVDLEATITLGEETPVKIVFHCTVFTRLDINTDDLAELVRQADALTQENYTGRTWENLQTALEIARRQASKPTGTEDVNNAMSDLQDAIDALIDKSQLDVKIKDLEREMQTLDQTAYTTASWAQLQSKLDAAKDVSEDPDATEDDINEAIADFPVAEEILVQKGEPEDLVSLVSDAEQLKDKLLAHKDDYTEESWNAFVAAIGTANSKLEEDLSQEEINDAIEALTLAINGLTPTVDQKPEEEEVEAFGSFITEAEGLTQEYYTEETWEAYQAAIDAAKELANKPNLTRNEIDAAKRAIEEASEALQTDINHTPTREEKEFLDNLTQEFAQLKEEDYSPETWQVFKAALEAAQKIAAKANATTEEVAQAKQNLQNAKDNLVSVQPGPGPGPGPNPVQADKAALKAAITNAASLNAADYTTDSWNAFQTALNQAKAIDGKANASQAEVDNALAALNTARNGLKAAPKDTKPVVKEKKVTKVTISGKNKLKIAAGKKITLAATVLPKDASNKKVTWKSSNTKYATVKNGKVTVNKKAAGKTVTITAAAADGSGKKATVKISVMKNAVTKVSLKAKSKKVKAGKKVTVKATVKTNGKKVNKTLEWTSSNTKWATVNSKGIVSAKKAGKGKTVTITAKATDGSNKKASVKIKIVK